MFPFWELHLQARLGMSQGPWSVLNTQTDKLKTTSETHSVSGQVDFCILQFLQMSENFFSCAFLIVLGIQIQAQTRSRTLVRRLHSVNHGDLRKVWEATNTNFLGTQKGMEKRHSGELSWWAQGPLTTLESNAVAIVTLQNLAVFHCQK